MTTTIPSVAAEHSEAEALFERVTTATVAADRATTGGTGHHIEH